MNAFLNPHNGTSLTDVIDITAHHISLFAKNGNNVEEPKDINFIYLGVILALLNLSMYR